MSRWFETTEAITQIESADERMTEMQEERNAERKRRIKAEARVTELEASVLAMHRDASALSVERDHYREALEEIAAGRWGGGVEKGGLPTPSQIARAALNP